MSTKGLVLITGVNGYIGARTAEAFLQAGYAVRGTVRSKASAASLVEALSRYGEKLGIVEVPDIAADGAFDDALTGGVTAIAHIASPVSTHLGDPAPAIRVAVRGTTGILESAVRQPSVRSFVLMSSIAAVTPKPSWEFVDGTEATLTEDDWNDWAGPMTTEKGAAAPGYAIYAASKAAAERAFWGFREQHKPHFTMTALNPCFVGGPPLVAPTSPEQVNLSNRMIWDVLSGHDLATAGIGGHPSLVDVRDVARLAVFAVDEADRADGQRYIAAAGFAPAQALADILRAAYPARRDLIKEGTPGQGYTKGSYDYPRRLAYDAGKAVRDTGVEWIPIEKTVLDTAKGLESLL